MAAKQTIAQAASQYLTSLHSQFAPQTILSYQQALHLFTSFLDNTFHIRPTITPISAIRPEWAHAYLAHLQETRSIETEHVYSRAILGFYQHLADHTHAISADDATNLATHLTHHRRTKQHTSPQLPLDAIDAILAHVATAIPPHHNQPGDRDYLRFHRDKGFLLTLAHTGLRVSEICGLRKIDIHASSHTIALSDQQPLILPLPVFTTLTHYLDARKPLDDAQRLFNIRHLPIFARHDKKAGKRILPISRWTAANIVDYWARIALPTNLLRDLAAHNCTLSPQTFRHYFVVATLQRTGNITETKTLARHGDASTTRRYLRYTDNHGNQLDINE